MKTRIFALAAIACLSGCGFFKVSGLGGDDAPTKAAGGARGERASETADASAEWMTKTDAAFEKWYGTIQPLVSAQQAELDKVVASSESVYEKEAAIEKVWEKTRQAPDFEHNHYKYFLQYPVIVAARKIHTDSGGDFATGRLLSKLDFRGGYEFWSRALGSKDLERDLFIYAVQKGEFDFMRLSSTKATDTFPIPKERMDAAGKTWKDAKDDNMNAFWRERSSTTTAFHATDPDTFVFLEARGAGDKGFANGRSNLRVAKVDKGSLVLAGFDRQSVAYGCSSAVGTEGGSLAIVPDCSYRQEDKKVEVVVGMRDQPPGGLAVGDLVELYATFKQKDLGKKKVTLRLDNAYFTKVERDDKTVFKR